MNKLKTTAFYAALVSSAAFGQEAYKVANTYYDAAQTIPKLEFNPAVSHFANGLKGVDLATAYINANFARYGLTKGLSELKLVSTQSSLLGTHFHFQQLDGEVPIVGAELVISVANSGDAIYMVYNAIRQQASVAGSKMKANDATITKDQAFDTAWAAVGVRGNLQAEPTATLVAVAYKKDTRLAYKVQLTVAKPLGAWEVLVDAKTGDLLAVEDRAILRSAHKRNRAYFLDGPVVNRALAFRNWNMKSQAARAQDDVAAPETVASGHGLVFDPDPRTTLNDDTLQDTSPAAAFDKAYFNRELKEITFDGTKYSLKGPWVQIADFEAPSTAPSTTTTGDWTDKRGKNSFNDAMTYFHIDQNQRYIQSLGFKNATGIQFGSIKADSDGLNGDDNSHYIPSSNQIAFGHGCVDDNEDSDVILHEYGHGLQNSINSNWGGGDTGAMGEGFGDYWAGSYSMKTPNGPVYMPNNVFSFDGHGPGNVCWPGRILNATNLTYDPGKTYGAHESMAGGRYTDELWSTPLFQSLVQLKAMGVDIAELDRAVLQSHFGIGSGPKMRDLANATIKAAQMLYPNGPHAKVLAANFAAQNLVELPAPKLTLTFKTTSVASDGNIFPGDKFTLSTTVVNSGTKAATDVHATISSTNAAASFDPATLSYGDLAPAGTNKEDTTVTVGANAVCGSEIPVEVKLSQTDFPAVTGVLSVRIGKEQGVSKSEAVATDIPDNNTTGITRTLTFDNTPAKVSANFRLSIDVQHPYRGDLTVKITSPSGTTVVLQDRGGSSADNLTGTYPVDLTPKESLDKLIGEPLQGTWKLFVSDSAATDSGSLASWGIKDVSGFSCVR